MMFIYHTAPQLFEISRKLRVFFTKNKILPPMIQKYWSIIEVLHEITRM